jgi:hypothetical protein
MGGTLKDSKMPSTAKLEIRKLAIFASVGNLHGFSNVHYERSPIYMGPLS